MPVGSWGPCVTSDLLQNPSTKRLPATPGTVCVDAVLPRAAGHTARLQPRGRGGSEGLVWGSLEAAGHVRDPAMPLGWVGAPHCSESPRCTLQALPLRGTQMTGAPALRLGSRCRGLCTKVPALTRLGAWSGARASPPPHAAQREQTEAPPPPGSPWPSGMAPGTTAPPTASAYVIPANVYPEENGRKVHTKAIPGFPQPLISGSILPVSSMT